MGRKGNSEEEWRKALLKEHVKKNPELIRELVERTSGVNTPGTIHRAIQNYELMYIPKEHVNIVKEVVLLLKTT